MGDAVERARQLSFGLFFFLIVSFLVVIFFVDVDKFIKRPDESLVINGTYVKVFKKGKLRWEVWAKQVIVDGEGEEHQLKSIYKGIYYRDKKPPFNFHAGDGLYRRSSEEVFLTGGIEFTSENGDYFNSEKVEWYGKAEKLLVPQELNLKLDNNTYHAGEMESTGADFKHVVLKNKVTVEVMDLYASGSKSVKKEIDESEIDQEYVKELRLEAERVEYEGEPKKTMKFFPVDDWRAIHIPGEEIAPIEKKVRLTGREFEMKAREAFVDLNQKYAHMQGEVWILRRGKEGVEEGAEEKKEEENKPGEKIKKRDAILETEEALYYWSQGTAQFPLPLRIYQEDVDVTAGKGYLNSKKDTAFLSEGVRLHQQKGGYLTKEDENGEPRAEDDPAAQETDVTCLMMDINFETEDLNARGDVYVKQEKRNLRGTAASYEKESGRWTVYGEPVMREEDSLLYADMFIFDEKEEFFQALGGVTAEVQLKKDDMEDVNEFYRERDGRTPGAGESSRAVMYSEKLQYDRKNDIVYSDTRSRAEFRDLEIEADAIRLDRDADFATGTGNVVAHDDYMTVTADSFEMRGKEKKLLIKGNVKLVEKAGRPAKDGGKPGEAFEMTADELEYNRGSEKGRANGNVIVRLEKGGRRITSGVMDMDRKNKIYVFKDNVQFHQENGEWIEDSAYAGDSKEGKAKKTANRPTDITCYRAVVNDAENTARFEDDVLVAQEGRRLRASIMEVDGNAKRFSATGNVYMEQDSGNWLFEDGLVDDDMDEDMKERLLKRLQVQSDSMESLYGEDKILFHGNVKILQGRAKATADNMWHFGEEKKTELEGNVDLLDEEGRSMKARRVVYDGKSKTTEAFGAVTGDSEITMD